MKKDIVGFNITTELLLNKEILEKENLEKILINIETEIANLIESKFKSKVIGGKGMYIYSNESNTLIEEQETFDGICPKCDSITDIVDITNEWICENCGCRFL